MFLTYPVSGYLCNCSGSPSHECSPMLFCVSPLVERLLKEPLLLRFAFAALAITFTALVCSVQRINKCLGIHTITMLPLELLLLLPWLEL